MAMPWPPRSSVTGSTAFTPLTFIASAPSKLMNLPLNTGGRTITAVSMPGSLTSTLYCCVPVLLARDTFRPVGLPMSLKSFASFNTTRSGIGSFIAASNSSP